MTVEKYSLSENRSSLFAKGFLNRFLKKRCPTQVDYPILNQVTHEEDVLTHEDDILSRLGNDTSQIYSLYWDEIAPESRIHQGMLFYTSDGMLIAGLAVEPDLCLVKYSIAQLCAFTGTNHFILRLDQPPPDSAQDFRAEAELEQFRDVAEFVHLAKT